MAKNLVFTLVVIILFFLLAEAVSGLIYSFWYKKYRNEILEEEAAFYKHDPVLGWVMTPNFAGFRYEGQDRCYYKTNSLGIRDEHSRFEKLQSVYRIFFLGDSITEGLGVDNDITIPKLVEKKLNSQSSKVKTEVINAGIVDYGIKQEYILLKEKGLLYQPDMVILGYFLNDARDFVPSKVLYIKGYENIINKSKFLYLLDRAIMKYKIKYQYKVWEKNRHEFWQPFYKTGTWRKNKEDRYKLVDLAKKDWGLAWTEKGWEATEYYLDKFLSLKEKYKFKFIVVCYPVAPQVYADESDVYMFLPQEKLKKYCQGHQIIFIDILQSIRGFKENEVFKDRCHYTHFGNQLVMQAIFDAIKNEIP